MTNRIRNISELARLAGVSPGTVSRALAGKSMVNAVTREKIQAIADEHGFRPNQMARRLRTQQTGAIGIVVPLMHGQHLHRIGPFYLALLGHLTDVLSARGYDVMLACPRLAEPDWLDQFVDSGMLEGVLMIGQADQFEAIEQVAARYRPLVVWGSHTAGQVHCAIGADDRAGGRVAGEGLIARGCKRLAFFGDLRARENELRWLGLQDATRAAGLIEPVHFGLGFDANRRADSIEGQATTAVNDEEPTPARIAAYLGSAGGGFDGVIAASDVIAMHTVRAFTNMGIAVPQTMPVVGFDDLSFAELYIPRPTNALPDTVGHDAAQAAHMMVETLFERIGGNDAASCALQPVLVHREVA